MGNTRLKIRRNIKLISIYSFFLEFRFINVVAILFFSQVAGSYALGMSIYSIVLFVTAFLEVPTGVISDKIGRKYTMVLCSLSDFIGILIYGFAGVYSSYPLLVLGAIFLGLADSLYSGTANALLYETLAELRKANKYHEVSGKNKSMMQLSSGLAAFIGSFIAYRYSYTIVAFMTAASVFMCFIITLFYVEPKKHKDECAEEGSWKHFVEAFKTLLINKRLLGIAIGSIISSSFGNTSHRFQVAYFETLIPVWLIGFVRGLKQIGGFFGAWYAGKIIDKFGHYKVITRGTIANTIIKIIALTINSVVSPFMFSLLNVFYSPVNIGVDHLMQNEFSNKQRATMGSIVSVFSSILFGINSVLVGYIADIASPLAALWYLLLPEFIVFGIYTKVLKHGK